MNHPATAGERVRVPCSILLEGLAGWLVSFFAGYLHIVRRVHGQQLDDDGGGEQKAVAQSGTYGEIGHAPLPTLSLQYSSGRWIGFYLWTNEKTYHAWGNTQCRRQSFYERHPNDS